MARSSSIEMSAALMRRDTGVRATPGDAGSSAPTIARKLKFGFTSSAALRARDLEEAGIPPDYLRRMTQRGLLEHVDRGVYRLERRARDRVALRRAGGRARASRHHQPAQRAAAAQTPRRRCRTRSGSCSAARQATSPPKRAPSMACASSSPRRPRPWPTASATVGAWVSASRLKLFATTCGSTEVVSMRSQPLQRLTVPTRSCGLISRH